MKYTFETEDEQEAQTLLNAQKSKSAIFDILAEFRKILKYEETLSVSQRVVVENLRDKVLEIIDEHNLPLE